MVVSGEDVAEEVATADPETVEAVVKLKTRQTQEVPKSILLQIRGGQGPDTLTYHPSTRARSTGTGGSPRDSVRSHGRVHGRIFIVSLQRTTNNETGTSPYKQLVTKYTECYTKMQRLKKYK